MKIVKNTNHNQEATEIIKEYNEIVDKIVEEEATKLRENPDRRRNVQNLYIKANKLLAELRLVSLRRKNINALDVGMNNRKKKKYKIF